MNRTQTVLMGVVAAGVCWLAWSQHRLSQQLDSVRAENARLNLALSHRPDSSREEFAALARRVDETRAAVEALGDRMASRAAVESMPRIASMPQTRSGRLTRRGPEIVDNPAALPAIMADTPAIPAESTRRTTPASSHGPTGERLSRSWGPEQLLGPPDTFVAGDQTTAWAPYLSQGGQEWLVLNYDQAVDVSEIRVHETYNPGAIAKVVAILPGGTEAVLWEGVTPPAQAPVDSAFPVAASVRAQSVKIYLERSRAPGWNEIDAVELVARDGTRQWASSASASSSYADR